MERRFLKSDRTSARPRSLSGSWLSGAGAAYHPRMITAFVRPPTSGLARCRLTFLEREPIDVERAREQHAAFVRALEAALGGDPERLALERAMLGASGGLGRVPPRVVRLPARPELPDSVFVEDAAVAVGRTVVLARPGAPERREEVDDVRAALLLAGGLPRVEAIREPGTLDGGDVLLLGQRVFVGLSERTNEEGARQLAAALGGGPEDREVVTVPVTGCLHLKTAATALSTGPEEPAVLVNPRWVDPAAFAPAAVVEVPEDEPFAANVLTLPGAPGEPPTVLVSSRWPKTRRLLEERGLKIVALDLSELEKAEAGPTCLALLCPPALPSRPGRG